MSLCLKKKKKPVPKPTPIAVTAPASSPQNPTARSRWGQQWQNSQNNNGQQFQNEGVQQHQFHGQLAQQSHPYLNYRQQPHIHGQLISKPANLIQNHGQQYQNHGQQYQTNGQQYPTNGHQYQTNGQQYQTHGQHPENYVPPQRLPHNHYDQQSQNHQSPPVPTPSWVQTENPSSNSKMMQQLQQAKRERAEKQKKQKAKQMGWSLMSEISGKKAEQAFETAPDEDEEEEVYEEEVPDFCQIRMKNVGRSTKTSAGPNSYGKSQVGGFQDSKALLKARQKQCEDLFYEEDRSQIEVKRQEKINVKERFVKEQARREKAKEKLKETDLGEIKNDPMQNIKPRRKSRFDAPETPGIDNSQRKYLPRDDGIFSKNRSYDPDFGTGEHRSPDRDRSPARKTQGYGSY